VTPFELALLVFFPALMAYSFSSDLITMTISNRISLALIFGFPVFAFAAGMPLADIGWHYLAGFTVLAVSFTLFAFGIIGGGDAKMVAATSVWLGFGHVLQFLALTSVLGGLLTFMILWYRSMPAPAFALNQDWMMRLHEKRGGVPYGMALGLAGLLVYPESQLWLTALRG
jgi:prepilin peptidase CpaA